MRASDSICRASLATMHDSRWPAIRSRSKTWGARTAPIGAVRRSVVLSRSWTAMRSGSGPCGSRSGSCLRRARRYCCDVPSLTRLVELLNFCPHRCSHLDRGSRLERARPAKDPFVHVEEMHRSVGLDGRIAKRDRASCHSRAIREAQVDRRSRISAASAGVKVKSPIVAWFAWVLSHALRITPVRECAPAERVPDSSLFRVSGSRHVHRGLGDAHLFAQPHTRRISQFNGFNSSTGSSISPLRAAATLPKIFMEFRDLQACGSASHGSVGELVPLSASARGASAPPSSSGLPRC